jgi:hypothetical protein
MSKSTLHYFDDEAGKMVSVPVDYEVKSHANDPCVLAAAKRAEEFLKRVGFPHELMKETKKTGER